MERRWASGILVAAAALSLLSIVLLPIQASSSPSPSPEGIRVLSAERRIDLTSYIVRISLTLKVENTGPNQASEVLIAFSPTESKHLSFVKATTSPDVKRKKKKHVRLAIKPYASPDAPNGSKQYSIFLDNPLNAGERAVLEVLYVFTHSLEPFPAEISQSESQLVYYRDSAKLLTPYFVEEQTTYLKTPNNKVESYTRVEPVHSGVQIKYGPYFNQPAYSFSPIILHFENNHPFAVVEELMREVEISHWGNIQIKEHYKLVHAGARHKGVFSRVDYQARPSSSGVSSFKHLLAKLPPRVHSVYYRDEIGNISSSHLRGDSQKTDLELEPRYPLFGGWKATFTIGYGLPLQDFLFESTDGRRYLDLSFGCPLIETAVDKLTIKVALPEGSKSPTVEVPFPVEQHLETSYSYLDVVGRSTVILKKENIVPEHNVLFQVYYDFSPVFMLAEPLMLISAFFLFFVACIAYMHMDLSIRKS